MEKSKIIEKFQKDSKDTGSTAVQVALKTEMIKNLSAHVKIHKKDNHSKRGLILAVSARKKLLAYIKRKDFAGYKTLIESLGLRK